MFDDPDKTAHFFFLTILGVALAWGLFAGMRQRLPAALRDAAIWVLIFFTFVTAYGFKDQFLAALNPSDARMLDAQTVELNRSRSGSFQAVLRINGQDLELLVDTGASDLVLSREDARRVGIDPSTLNFLGRASTANGEVSTAFVNLDSVQIGDIVDYDVGARVNGGDLSISLLGISYLDRFRSWQVEGDRMILRR
ncbi:MAG: TIGR02281 family clan AA aspartic protease [Pseudomonadota bacterium]